MDDKCLFKVCYKCSDSETLQVSQNDGSRLHNTMEASKIHGHNLHLKLQTKFNCDSMYQAKYHKSCVSKYLTKAKRMSVKRVAPSPESGPSILPEKRTRSSMEHSFDWLHQCLYCGGPYNAVKDSRHPNRWNPAYLVREVEKKASDGSEKAESIEKKIKDKCYERADEWAGNILVLLTGLTIRATDHHAADARYHRDCYVRFFSDRSLSGDTKKKESSTGSSHTPLQLLVDELQSQRSQRWDSVLMERFMELGGMPMRQSTLINSICEMLEDLVVLSSPGYRSIVFFRDSALATLKMIKDNNEEDNLDAALNVVVKHIRKECSDMEYQRRTYSTKISKDIANKSVPDTLQQLLSKLSFDEQSLPSLLIGNIITSAIKKHPTSLQIALGVFFNKKKTIQHMHDYLVCCSYEELLRFKRSSAVGKYLQICSQQ